MTAQINYQNFQPDWWDGVGATSDAVKAAIDDAISESLGGAGIPAIQQQAITESAQLHYQAQQAMKAAAEAAQQASNYSDTPNSPLYQNSIASVTANETLAASYTAQATEVMQNSGATEALVANIGKIASVLGPAINAVQMGAALETGDAYDVAQTAVGILAGMAIGSLVLSAAGFIGLPFVAAAAAGIAAGFAAGKFWEWMWGSGAADYYGIKQEDEFSFSRIGNAIASLFSSAQKWVPRRDPLTLDLNGNGLETIAPNATNPILFNMDGNDEGIKTGTGWVAPSDGFLVWDKNGNGIIDSGREMFGDAFIKANGQTATDGFDALASLDSNGDGVVDANDANFSSLRVWQDTNQNGITDAGELKTLSSLGIASFKVSASVNSQVLPNGNQIADLGSYTKSDGTIAMLGDVSQMADVNLATDTFHREFTDTIPLATGVDALPKMTMYKPSFFNRAYGKIYVFLKTDKQIRQKSIKYLFGGMVISYFLFMNEAAAMEKIISKRRMDAAEFAVIQNVFVIGLEKACSNLSTSEGVKLHTAIDIWKDRNKNDITSSNFYWNLIDEVLKDKYGDASATEYKEKFNKRVKEISAGLLLNALGKMPPDGGKCVSVAIDLNKNSDGLIRLKFKDPKAFDEIKKIKADADSKIK